MRTLFHGRRGTLGLLLLGALIGAVEAIVLVVAVPGGNALGGSVTVEDAQVRWIEGTGATGQLWFGPAFANLSGPASGYPFSTPVGSTFTLTFPFGNTDAANHTVLSAQASPPFQIVGVHPSLPVVVPAGEDDAGLTFTVLAPGSSTSATLDIVLSAD